jgi:hypothetical protein
MNEWSTPDSGGVKEIVLNEYAITLDFNLPHNLSDIAEANLLLYQLEELSTIDHPVGDRYQLVQIRTVIDNISYFVEKKVVEINNYGMKSFNIKHAAELWVEEGVSGNVVLQVFVTCYSSPNCSDSSEQAKVSFGQTSDPSTAPRIITVSRNPLEAEHRIREKRHSSTLEPALQYCERNESLCCLHPLEINFHTDLGLTFILEPRTYIANFCNGHCPEVTGTGLGTSQRFQLLRFLTPTRSIRPCCSGIEYRPLQILVTLYNPTTRRYDTRLDVLEQVIVTKCVCG